MSINLFIECAECGTYYTLDHDVQYCCGVQLPDTEPEEEDKWSLEEEWYMEHIARRTGK